MQFSQLNLSNLAEINFIDIILKNTSAPYFNKKKQIAKCPLFAAQCNEVISTLIKC